MNLNGVWLCFEWLGVKGNEKFGLWTGNYTEERETRVRRLAVATQKREKEKTEGKVILGFLSIFRRCGDEMDF